MSNYNLGKLVPDLIGLGVFPPKGFSDFTLAQMAEYFGYVTPLNFGAVGDGVADDFQAVTDALVYGEANQVVVDGVGLTYKVNTAITSPVYKAQNMTIDGSAIATGTVWVADSGAVFEAAKSLTANTRQGSNAFAATGHGFLPGDVILAQSNLIAETATNSLASHWGRVRTIPTADSFTVDEGAYVNLLTANAASVRRLPKVAVEFSSIKIIGGASAVNGLSLLNYSDAVLRDIHVESCAARSVVLQQCYNTYISSVFAKDSNAAGLGYGIVVAGCGNTRVDFIRGQNCRHVLTHGAYGTTPCTGGSFGDVVGTHCTAAVVDTHPAVFGISSTGKIVGDMRTEAGEDGITWQAAGGHINVELTGNIARHCILLQPFYVAAAFDKFPSYGVHVVGDVTVGDNGVMGDFTSNAAINTIDIYADITTNTRPIYLNLGGIAVENINIAGVGKSLTSRGCQVSGVALTNVGHISQVGNWTAAAFETAYYLMGTDASVRTTEISVASGKMSGGTYGLRVGNKANAKVAAAFMSGSSGASSASPAPAVITVLS